MFLIHFFLRAATTAASDIEKNAQNDRKKDILHNILQYASQGKLAGFNWTVYLSTPIS